jgi:hypothetical protein
LTQSLAGSSSGALRTNSLQWFFALGRNNTIMDRRGLYREFQFLQPAVSAVSVLRPDQRELESGDVILSV